MTPVVCAGGTPIHTIFRWHAGLASADVTVVWADGANWRFRFVPAAGVLSVEVKNDLRLDLRFVAAMGGPYAAMARGLLEH